MKITGLLLALMMFASVCFADQPTTVYSRLLTGSVTGTMPETDGLNSLDIQQAANRSLAQAADSLTKELGSCELSYTVTLNRPSVIGVLLKAQNAQQTLYKGVNIDLTSGRAITLTEFFREGTGIREITGEYYDALLGENGLLLSSAPGAPYDRAVPYSALLRVIRTGQAGRLLPIIKLTQAAEGKLVTVPAGSLIAVKLDANRSTGFSWALNSPDAANVYEAGRSYLMPVNIDNQTGVQGSEIIFIAVQNPGSYKINMEYKRPWERLSLQSFSFDVAAG